MEIEVKIFHEGLELSDDAQIPKIGRLYYKHILSIRHIFLKTLTGIVIELEDHWRCEHYNIKAHNTMHLIWKMKEEGQNPSEEKSLTLEFCSEAHD